LQHATPARVAKTKARKYVLVITVDFGEDGSADAMQNCSIAGREKQHCRIASTESLVAPKRVQRVPVGEGQAFRA
jgi:hypothetical protein